MLKCEKHVASRLVLLGIVSWLLGPARVLAQQPEPLQVPSAPPLPATSAPITATTPHEAQLEARVRQLEAMVNQLSQQVSQMSPAAGGNGAATAGAAGANGAPSPGGEPGYTTTPNRVEA